MTFTEAQAFLPAAYAPLPLVGVEEDLPLSADAGVVFASAGSTIQQWNLFGEWGLGLSRDLPLQLSQDTAVAILDSGFCDHAGGYDFISDPNLAAYGD